jgi:hypothetical protein
VHGLALSEVVVLAVEDSVMSFCSVLLRLISGNWMKITEKSHSVVSNRNMCRAVNNYKSVKEPV